MKNLNKNAKVEKLTGWQLLISLQLLKYKKTYVRHSYLTVFFCAKINNILTNL